MTVNTAAEQLLEIEEKLQLGGNELAYYVNII
jgi:hypothetical protein